MNEHFCSEGQYVLVKPFQSQFAFRLLICSLTIASKLFCEALSRCAKLLPVSPEPHGVRMEWSWFFFSCDLSSFGEQASSKQEKDWISLTFLQQWCFTASFLNATRRQWLLYGEALPIVTPSQWFHGIGLLVTSQSSDVVCRRWSGKNPLCFLSRKV